MTEAEAVEVCVRAGAGHGNDNNHLFELSSCLHSAERFLDGIHLILPVAQGGRCSYTPSFRAEETEV